MITDVDLEDIAILTALIFVLFSMAIFWKLYFFQPPTKSQVEDELQNKSHAVSNEASQLQSTIRHIDKNVDVLRVLVRDMQHRRRSDRERKHPS